MSRAAKRELREATRELCIAAVAHTIGELTPAKAAQLAAESPTYARLLRAAARYLHALKAAGWRGWRR